MYHIVVFWLNMLCVRVHHLSVYKAEDIRRTVPLAAIDG